MTTDRIKEIQSKTAYPDSVSVQQALLQVWNECEQERLCLNASSLQLKDIKRLSFEDWKSFLYKNTETTYLINDKEVLEYELINIYNKLHD